MSLPGNVSILQQLKWKADVQLKTRLLPLQAIPSTVVEGAGRATSLATRLAVRCVFTVHRGQIARPRS